MSLLLESFHFFPRKAVGRLFVLLLVACFLTTGFVYSESLSPADTTENPLVQQVRFEGNEHFSSSTLQRRIRTERNRRFLGIPGLTWWLWLYRMGESEAFGERIGDALRASGEPPAYLNQSRLAGDVDRLEAFYRQEGFRDAEVDVRTEHLSDSRVAVVFRIASGTPIYSREVRYEGIAHLTPEQREIILQHSRLRQSGTLDLEENRLEADGQRYSESTLLEERQRILQYLRDEGYASVSRDSIRAVVYPQEPDSFDVEFRIGTGPRYRLGDVHFTATGPEDGVGSRSGTIQQESPGTVTYQISGDRRLHPRLMERSMAIEPGDWYSHSAMLDLKRRLEATGVFAFTDVASQAPDTVTTSQDTTYYLPHRINMQTRPRHLMRFETFMMQRTGLLSAESEFGVGLGSTYENVNLFGGGESFRIRGSGSVAADFDNWFLSSSQAELNTSLTYPYLAWPFGPIENALNLYNAQTQLSLSLLTARRENLRFILRSRGNARYRLNMQHTNTLSSIVDVFDVSLSDPDTLAGFHEFLDEIIGTEDNPLIQDPVQRQQIQEDYTEPQVNSVIRYTFRSARFNPLQRNEGYNYEVSFSVGNTMPYLLDRYVIEPGNVTYRLPGLPLLGGDSELLYRPYVRMVTDLRHYHPIREGNTVAFKFIGGWAHPTGEPNLVPFDRRFYSGGASSVRGWGLRELRPRGGTARDDIPNILGGDIKLEASAEMRSDFLLDVLGADWSLAAFTDIGNVWFGPRSPGAPEGQFEFDRFYRELAVGTGVGLRANWDFLILRLDLAHRVHDPLRPGTGLFPDGLSQPRLHFGIGQPF